MSPEDQAAKEAEKEDVQGSDAIAALRAEFVKKFDEMKSSNEAVISSKDKEIADLTKEVTDLRAEVVRSATIPKIETEKPKTEEEIYTDEVNLAAEVTLNLMKDMS